MGNERRSERREGGRGGDDRWMLPGLTGAIHACTLRSAALAVTFTNFRMRYWQIGIAIERFLAVTTMPASCIMLALNTDSTRFSTREEIEFFIETTLSRVIVTVARCKTYTKSFDGRRRGACCLRSPLFRCLFPSVGVGMSERERCG